MKEWARSHVRKDILTHCGLVILIAYESFESFQNITHIFGKIYQIYGIFVVVI